MVYMMGSKIKGYILANSFLRTEKFTSHYKRLINSARRYGAELSVLGNADIFSAYCTDSEKRLLSMLEGISFVIYWDKDIRLGRQAGQVCRQMGIPVYNPVEVAEICDDKSYTYQKLWEWNQSHPDSGRIPLVPTITAPMTYMNTGYTDTAFLDRVIEELGLPVVVKECYGSFGQQVYLAGSRQELESLVLKLGGTPHIYQKFIKESSGRDVRLEVVGGKVEAAICRYSVNGDFRANITNGAHMKPYSPSARECETAIKTAEILGLCFGGIDLLFGNGDGEALTVCEVNSNAHFKNISDCTGIDIADKIMYYILNTLRGTG